MLDLYCWPILAAEAESEEEVKVDAPFCSDEDASLLELGPESDVVMFWLYEGGGFAVATTDSAWMGAAVVEVS